MYIIRSIYFSTLFWLIIISLSICFFVAYSFDFLFPLVKLALWAFVLLIFVDILLLFLKKESIFARREAPERLSNADKNPISIYLENKYPFSVSLQIIDEIPFQFQKRDVFFEAKLQSNENQIIEYDLRPTQRGEYNFGAVNVFVLSPLKLIKRRFKFSQNKMVAVYPSFLQMRKYEFMAFSNRLTEYGIKKMRRIGQSMEFEQIRQYVKGDDVRTVNWKATARRNELMINAFQEEKSQPIYCFIDKGRAMQSPFEGLTLLDYAINATLVLANIALLKQDKAGLFTFSEVLGQFLPADRRNGQLGKILELLYKQKTRFLESNFELLYANIRTKIKQRSMILLFTNFETTNALNRQMPYLRSIAKEHLLVVIFFENTEMKNILQNVPANTEEIYKKTIAEKFIYDKKLIVKELEKYGIQSILTSPEKLNVNTINKYLELKARGMM